MNEIIASPKYGRYISKSVKIILISEIMLFTAFLLSSVVVIILILSNILEDDGIVIGILTATSIMGISINTVLVFILNKQNHFDRDLKEWQKDFQKLYADVFLSDRIASLNVGFFVLKVEFRINKKKHTKIIRIKDKDYNRIFKKCVGYKVPIYYSATYDEIVFIKKT